MLLYTFRTLTLRRKKIIRMQTRKDWKQRAQTWSDRALQISSSSRHLMDNSSSSGVDAANRLYLSHHKDMNITSAAGDIKFCMTDVIN